MIVVKLLSLYLLVPIFTVFIFGIAPILPNTLWVQNKYIYGIHLWARFILWSAKINLHISSEDIDKLYTNSSQIIISNHQSNLDPVILLASFHPTKVRPCFAAKEILFRIPFYNSGLKLSGSIEIDRGKGKLSMQRLRESFLNSNRRRSLIIFPEGGRGEKGELRSFKKGAFKLSQELDVRILPIFISGSADAMPKGTIVPQPTEITIKIMKPITSTQVLEMGIRAASCYSWDMMNKEYSKLPKK